MVNVTMFVWKWCQNVKRCPEIMSKYCMRVVLRQHYLVLVTSRAEILIGYARKNVDGVYWVCILNNERYNATSLVILSVYFSTSYTYNTNYRMTKPTKRPVCPAKTQISLGIHTVWSESSLCAWRNLWSLATHWAHSEDSDQKGGCPGWIESSLGA